MSIYSHDTFLRLENGGLNLAWDFGVNFLGIPNCVIGRIFYFFLKKNFGLKGVIELMWGLFPCILIFESFNFLIIKRHYEIENLNFCVKLMRWFAAIHTTTTLPFDFCAISKILICFSLIKHFSNSYKSCSSHLQVSILHRVAPIKVFLP